MPSFARATAPRNKSFYKDKPRKFIELNEYELNALEALETTVVSPAVLTLPLPNEKSKVDKDANDKQVRWVLRE